METELEEQTTFTVTLLGYVAFGAFTKLEETERVTVALLVEGAGVVIAVLFDDTEVAGTVLQEASSVAVAQLTKGGFITLQTLEQSVEKETVCDGLLFLWGGTLNTDGDAAGDVGVGVSRSRNCGERESDQSYSSRALDSRDEEHGFNLSMSALCEGESLSERAWCLFVSVVLSLPPAVERGVAAFDKKRFATLT